MKYQYNPPYLIKNLFSFFQWDSKIDKILFTFDDGPVPESTPLILDTLLKHNIKAAFFCVGENIEKHPDLYRRIVAGGHLVGNHTYNHKAISKLNRDQAVEQIELFNTVINQHAGNRVLYFRPPYGKFDLSTLGVLKKMNLKTVMWSLLTYDFKKSIGTVKFAAEKYLRKNSIIVLHDSLKSKDIIAGSISYIVEEASHKGFQIGAPAECLR
jgi:peptidoglycan/xylan/chitin deacetylase (PgdA/CDA1 family)